MAVCDGTPNERRSEYFFLFKFYLHFYLFSGHASGRQSFRTFDGRDNAAAAAASIAVDSAAAASHFQCHPDGA